jgi:peroxiredoxin Q/BCP
MKHLKIGDKAPDFKSLDQNGNSIQLSDFLGSKLVLFFYPKASTPGCTLEAQNLRDHYQDFLDKNYKVVGVSADAVAKQKNFCDKNQLPFPLIADVSKEVIQAYGVWGPKKFMGKEFDGIHRTTFIINADGMIESIIEKVETKNHAYQILSF